LILRIAAKPGCPIAGGYDAGEYSEMAVALWKFGGGYRESFKNTGALRSAVTFL
jgi:hypothetical protein